MTAKFQILALDKLQRLHRLLHFNLRKYLRIPLCTNTLDHLCSGYLLQPSSAQLTYVPLPLSTLSITLLISKII